MTHRVYLDHAATRFPKDPIVLDTMHAFSNECEAAVGRGAYRSSQKAGEIVSNLRRELAGWIDADSDREISFHSNGTMALNAAIFGLLREGDHVVTSAAEHNSVLRPLHHLCNSGMIDWTIVPVDRCGQVSADKVMSAVRRDTKLVAITHAGNVNGAVQPVSEISRRLAECDKVRNKPLLLCDAAQSFGYLPISVSAWGIDVLAAPGHKGGCGPLGTGFLYVKQRLFGEIRPTVFGGTGSQSESLEMPNDYPWSFEAGNRNVPALAGWLAGLRSIRGEKSRMQRLAESESHMRDLAADLYRRLSDLDGIQIVGEPPSTSLPVASINVPGLSPSDVAMILDSEFGIEVRSGLHCAALIHDAIGSPEGGTVRISCGENTTSGEMDLLCGALTEIAAQGVL